MSITESNDEDEEERSDPNSSDENGESTQDIPNEFIDLYNDDELKQVLIDLIHTAADLDIFTSKSSADTLIRPNPLGIKLRLQLESIFLFIKLLLIYYYQSDLLSS